MMPAPATLFLGYALLGGALFLFATGMRAFLQESQASLPAQAPTRRRAGTGRAQAVASLFLATLLLLAATIALIMVTPRLL